MEILKKNFVQNPLAWTVQIVGLFVILANIWITLKLAPVAKDIDRVSTRVTAVELRNTEADPILKDFVVVKTQVGGIKEDISEIKQDVKDISKFLNVR